MGWPSVDCWQIKGQLLNSDWHHDAVPCHVSQGPQEESEDPGRLTPEGHRYTLRVDDVVGLSGRCQQSGHGESGALERRHGGGLLVGVGAGEPCIRVIAAARDRETTRAGRDYGVVNYMQETCGRDDKSRRKEESGDVSGGHGTTEGLGGLRYGSEGREGEGSRQQRPGASINKRTFHYSCNDKPSRPAGRAMATVELSGQRATREIGAYPHQSPSRPPPTHSPWPMSHVAGPCRPHVHVPSGPCPCVQCRPIPAS